VNNNQQIAAVFQRTRDLTHLELSSSEWRLLEDVAKVLEPYKDITTYLSYPTISSLGPLYSAIKDKSSPTNDDSPAVQRFKLLLAIDMSTRYQDPTVSLCLYKASFLDPKFKTLAHISKSQQEEVIKDISDELVDIVVYVSSGEECEDVVVTEVSDLTEETQESAPHKKPRLALLEKLPGKRFEDQSAASGATAVSRSENVQAEISQYKGMPVIGLGEKPLQSWNSNKHILPNLAKLAQKYLGIVATSIPSEHLFSVAGNIASAKRAALLSENVEKLVFLHENSPLHLK